MIVKHPIDLHTVPNVTNSDNAIIDHSHHSYTIEAVKHVCCSCLEQSLFLLLQLQSVIPEHMPTRCNRVNFSVMNGVQNRFTPLR